MHLTRRGGSSPAKKRLHRDSSAQVIIVQLYSFQRAAKPMPFGLSVSFFSCSACMAAALLAQASNSCQVGFPLPDCWHSSTSFAIACFCYANSFFFASAAAFFTRVVSHTAANFSPATHGLGASGRSSSSRILRLPARTTAYIEPIVVVARAHRGCCRSAVRWLFRPAGWSGEAAVVVMSNELALKRWTE